MSEASKAVVRRLLELSAARDVDRLGEVMAEDVALHGEEEARGIDAVIEHSRSFFQAFPDLETSVQDLIAEDDLVVLRATIRGTHQGPFGPIPATGRTVEFGDIDIFRVREGKIVEMWVAPDRFALMQQLGLLGEDEAGEPE